MPPNHFQQDVAAQKGCYIVLQAEEVKAGASIWLIFDGDAYLYVRMIAAATSALAFAVRRVVFFVGEDADFLDAVLVGEGLGGVPSGFVGLCLAA